MYHFLVGCMQK